MSTTNDRLCTGYLCPPSVIAMQQSVVPDVERWMSVLLLATRNAGPANQPHTNQPHTNEPHVSHPDASRMRRVPSMVSASHPRRTVPQNLAREKQVQIVQNAPPMAAKHNASSRTSKLLQLAADLHLV